MKTFQFTAEVIAGPDDGAVYTIELESNHPADHLLVNAETLSIAGQEYEVVSTNPANFSMKIKPVAP